jgi:hypothetical protein
VGSRQQWESSRRRRPKQPLTGLQERSDRIDLDIGAIMPFRRMIGLIDPSMSPSCLATS